MPMRTILARIKKFLKWFIDDFKGIKITPKECEKYYIKID